MWQKEDDNIGRNWYDTDTFCNDSDLAGYTDWRLPNVKEMLTIVDYALYSPAIDQTYFPNTDFSKYWSSTSANSLTAWPVSFSLGVSTADSKYNSNYVRCVRGGQ